MNLHFKKTVFALTLLAAAGAHSQTLRLTQAFQQALRHDPGTLAAEQALLAGREKAVQGEALLKPQVSLGASVTGISSHAYSNLPDPVSSLVSPDSSGHVGEAAVKVLQPLYNSSYSASKQQLISQTAGAEIRWTAAVQDLTKRVAESYLAVLSAQDTLRVTRAEETTLAEQRERAQARFDVGSGRITDVQEARARHDGTVAKLIGAQSALALRQAQFQWLTGASAQGLADLARVSRLPAPPPELLADWQRKGQERNAYVQSKRIELDVARQEVAKYRLDSRPTLDLVGAYTMKGKGGDLSPLVAADRERTASVGLQLSIPLYTGGALNSREREALAKMRQTEQELAGAQQDVQLQIHDAYLALHTGLARVQALQRAQESSQSALDATVLGRDVGSRSQPDVLDAQQRFYAAQLDASQARIDVLLAQVRLAWAAGALSENDLQAIDAILLP
jgi:outer membrane protein